jgi:hypothetical protein
MHRVQRVKDVEGYSLGKVCANKQFAIDAKDEATFSEIVETLANHQFGQGQYNG